MHLISYGLLLAELVFIVYLLVEFTCSNIYTTLDKPMPHRLARFLRLASRIIDGDIKGHWCCQRCGISRRLTPIHATIYEEWSCSGNTGQLELFPDMTSVSFIDVLCEHCRKELPLEQQLVYIVPYVEQRYPDPAERNLIYKAVLAGK